MAPLGDDLLTALAGAPLGEAVAVQALADATGLTNRAVCNGLATLQRHHLVEAIRRGHYRLTDAGRQAAMDGRAPTSGPNGPTGPRLGRRKSTLRDRVWSALRMERSATVPDLLRAASSGAERAAAGNIGRYLRTLERAGYVVAKPRRRPGAALTSPGHICWLLVRDTGPRAPRIRRVDGGWLVSDPNNGEATPCRD